jgi:putative acetyltransferase
LGLHLHNNIFIESTDLVPLLNLIHRTIDKCYPSFYEELVIRYFKEYHDRNNIIERAEKGYMLVYKIKDAIIGTGSLIGDYVNAVYVDPAYQGKGIGKQIMFALFKKAKQMNITKLRLDATPGSRDFYLSLGFVFVSEETMMVDNVFPLLYYVMEKELK